MAEKAFVLVGEMNRLVWDGRAKGGKLENSE